MFEAGAKKAGQIIGKPVGGLPEQDYNCPVHGVYTGRPIEVMGMSFSALCPECAKEDEESIDLKRKEAEELREAKVRKEREEYLTQMNIGEKFWKESFETFDAYTEGLKRRLDTCINFANDHQGRMLLMMGKNGNGKNHLAASILHKTGGCSYSVLEIELLLKDCYSKKTGELQLYQRLCETPMLIINEIGKHKPGEWETNFLSYIINKRYENLMPTVLITNTHLKADCPKKGCPDCLQQFLGNDVFSRIVETGEIMHFKEQDYRYIKREKQAQRG